MKKLIIGIDISSKTLDICIKKDNEYLYENLSNEVKSIKKFFKTISKEKDYQILVTMENTGRYNWNLYEVLEQFSFVVFVINPLHLKKSLGLIRGKNDKIDARRISDFTFKNSDDLPQWKPATQSIKTLKVLFSERNSKVKLRASLLKRKMLHHQTKGLKLDKMLLSMTENEIKILAKHIDLLEDKIEELIASDADLSQKQKTIKSIPGVGKVLSWMLIAKTEGFTRIEDARKLACYSGVVPFENQSGTFLRHKPRVSFYADKSLKSILHLAAMSAIRLDNDLRAYYLRKVEEGKNKMLVLNNVRNKIIHRVFAIIKSGKLYEKNYTNHLVMS